jgi:methionyl aminopeptidase
MDQEVLKKYDESRKISDAVLELAKKTVREGAKIIELAEKIEAKTKELNGGIAFPANISINDIAAHYTPDVDDKTELKEGDLVKVDFGVHTDGYIWDRAFSISIGQKNNSLIEASEKAVNNALKIIKAGVKVCEISDVIEKTISEFGLKPIYNLCGHGLEQYVQHAEPTIPNAENNNKTELKEGNVVAIEVFTTDGAGYVKESGTTLIYRFLNPRPVRLWEGRLILQKAERDFHGMPFAKRWLADIAKGAKLDIILSQLVGMNALMSYPVLREESGSLVAQTEETIIVK